MTLKLATSLDGRIALANGKSQWITSDLARQVQNHRGMSCAILSTAETVLVDQASLTFRPNQRLRSMLNTMRALIAAMPDNPFELFLISIIDSLVMSHCSNLRDIVLVITNTNTLNIAKGALSNSRKFSQGLNVAKVFDALAAQFDINHVWVEAGAKLAGSLLTNGLVDQLIQYQAPKLLGDSAKAMVSLPELTELSQSYRFDVKKVETVGHDIKITMLTADATSSIWNNCEIQHVYRNH